MTRPLRGEPLPIDLLNTTWRDEGVAHDALADDDGLAEWLEEWSFDVPATDATRAALVEARGAVRGLLADRSAPAAVDAFNDILDRGRVRVALADDGSVERTIDGVAPEWLPGVSAAHALVELMETSGDRIRPCQHEECVLWFVDTSRNGTRRWCSMAVCGNRAKASRHYRRTHPA
ncbi:MAG: CGNR zinc finger domain-containing protein [Actinomycetota bacterium]|nr:CGNR zinc finger domain-containing protein [Actinomycetota bacterium]